MLITGTVLFASASSTALLGLVVYPYVGRLYERVPAESSGEGDNHLADSKESADAKERTLIAERYNIFGNTVTTTFTLSQVEKDGIMNPFASFKVKNQGNYFVDGTVLKDSSLRKALSKSKTW